MLRRRGLITQLPSAVARALARQMNLILMDQEGELFFNNTFCASFSVRFSGHKAVKALFACR